MANPIEEVIENEFLELDFDEENSGSVRRIQEGFNKLDSLWILGFNATRYRYGKWIITWTFNPITTDGPANPGGKKPITQYGVETNQILKLQKAQSPGKFYIDNVALAPNMSGHGGNPAFRYASSEFSDLVGSFVRNGADDFIQNAKEILIPESLQNHIDTVNKTVRNLRDPQGSLYNFARQKVTSQVDKIPELKRFFKFTKQTIRIGAEIGEVVLAPEATAGKAFWTLGGKRALGVAKVWKNKQIKNIRGNIADKLL